MDFTGGSTLSMAKFLSTNLTDIQKNKAFMNRGEGIDKLFVKDVYIDTTPRAD